MRKERILVVDDSQLVRKKYTRILKKHGMEVLAAPDGQEGCRRVFDFQPDVIIMDLIMPVVDGMSAIRLLKSHEQTQHIPIIVFTTECSLEEKVKALEAGANDFLSKQSDEVELIARIKSLLMLKALEDRLLHEKVKFGSILNDLAEAVVIIDRENRVILSNNAASDLLNTPPELVGTIEISELVAESDKASEFVDRLSRDELDDFTLELNTPYGRKSFKVSSNPVFLAYGEPLGKALVFRDVTQEMEMEKLKASFYSMIAHDLRSPISVISGYAGLILEGKAGSLEDAQKEFLEAIQSRSLSMLKLVDEFLTVSKFEASFVALDLEYVDLHQLLQEVVESLRLIASNKRISLKIKRKSKLQVIQADSQKIYKVFSNLLDNALKYTPEGGSVTIVAKGSADDIRIEMKDTGIGIERDELEHVFDRFRRSASAERRKIKGTGLGLTIVKEIVSAHNGKVWVESEFGKGSTFIVVLPISQQVDQKKAKGKKKFADVIN